MLRLSYVLTAKKLSIALDLYLTLCICLSLLNYAKLYLKGNFPLFVK